MMRGRGSLLETEVTMAHGGGGQAMRELIDDVFRPAFDPDGEAPWEDQARLPLSGLTRRGDRLAFTTDSYVVHPLFFPGGDLGKIAVCGTINDLAVGGAVPLVLSCSVIIEEGLPVEVLRRIADSMAETARGAGVSIVTGDTKVVGRGACDRLFVNTSGIGVIPEGVQLGVGMAREGDAILVNGVLGDHGAAILAARGDLHVKTTIESDCAALHTLVAAMLASGPGVRFLRDATRGGLATVLNEIAAASRVAVEIDERATPLRPEVRGICELLGLDPLYLANEGRLVAVVAPAHVDAVVGAMRAHPLGREAVVIGRVVAGRPGRVVMHTSLGGRRIVDMLVGDQLPRIC